MQSHQDSFGPNGKLMGHRRLPSLGKSMPVTSLFLDSFSSTTASIRANYNNDGFISRDISNDEHNIGDSSTESYGEITDSVTDMDTDAASSLGDSMSICQELDNTVSDCGFPTAEDDDAPNGGGGGLNNDDWHDRLAGNSAAAPCLLCTGQAPDYLANRPSAINEMCRRFCTDECRLRLSLGGFLPCSTNKGSDDLHALMCHHHIDAPHCAPITGWAGKKETYVPMVAGSAKNTAEYDATVAGADEGRDECDKSGAPAVDFDDMKDSAQLAEIAEALAKTSAMTPAGAKQRLAARKLELELDNLIKPSFRRRCASLCGLADAVNDNAIADDACARLVKNEKAVDIAKANRNIGDIEPDKVATDSEFVPPRNILMYLVRMGSFNSAPKINNVDSQDDGLEIPKHMTASELLAHVKQLRGVHLPPLLDRYFLKTSGGVDAMPNDITDGLRCLHLNSMSRVCSPPQSSANQLRLLQWNILSQSLGQNNDSFVCCPKEALTWDSRKFLIIQEILQYSPDIICLQEVDHFKFLQNILGTQNYEGIFFPKPDSPCLYIEENNGPDGCAIFYKRDKFLLQGYDTRILEVWHVPSNQVAIAINLLIKATGREFCVATTHLKARNGLLLSKLRNEQGMDLVRFVKRFAGNRPVLISGDFNAEPCEPIYQTLLTRDELPLASAYADINASKNEQYFKDKLTDNRLTVQESMLREPKYTTWKIREQGEECHTIDYVFYQRNQFKIKNCLDFPSGSAIGKNRTPSFQYPSDHFSLVCDFENLDNNPTTNGANETLES